MSGDSPNDRFYLPTVGDRLRLMGWRNLFWLPPILVLLWIASATFYGGFTSLLSLLVWWKPITLAFGLPLAAAMRATAVALSARQDPFCIHCGYSLNGLPVTADQRFTCPECGASVDLVESADYQRDPHWFIQRQQMSHPAHAPFEAGAHREVNADRV